MTIIRSIIGVRQSDDDYDSVEGSGDETEGSGVSFGVEIEPGSFLDMVFNIIPGRIRPDQTDVNNEEDADDDYYSYDYDQNYDGTDDMSVVLENDPSDGGSSIGAVSVSLHPIDLAELFVQVQKTVMENTTGMNCTCGEELMTEERITDATLRIIEDSRKRKRRQRLRNGRGKKSAPK